MSQRVVLKIEQSLNENKKKSPNTLSAINTFAKQIRKADPKMSQQEAVAKASAVYRDMAKK